MDDFFQRVEGRQHAWPAGRRDLHWHVLFPVDEVRRKLTKPYQGLSHRAGIEPVAPEWAHMTVLHSGPEDEATAAEISQITDRISKHARRIAPFDVTFAQPAVGNVAIECLGRPGTPARALWEATWSATHAVVGERWPRIPANYYPHISLGYATAAAEKADREAMKVWLSDHGQGEVTLRAQRLVFVAQWHDRRRILWDTLADLPLGGQ